MMIQGLLIGLLAAFQLDFDTIINPAISGNPGYGLGVAGALLALAMWIHSGDRLEDRPCSSGDHYEIASKPTLRRVIDDTNFITTWVIFSFVGYELAASALGLDLGASLAVWAPLVPAMTIVIGLILGCGPQILVTSLYVSGAIPLSAQPGNAIAVAPKAALVATLYNALPAIAVAYGWFLVME